MGKITEVQEVPVSKLIPYVNNAKIHSEEQVTKIASSMREFGFINPILIDKDFNVIAGHGRLMAAKKLDMENVPCLFIEGLSEAQRKAYILADNRLGELAEWDMELVVSELEQLKDMDFSVELSGFDMPNFGTQDSWFETRERNDTSKQDGNDEYNEFLEKFEVKKTTDDCYTPDIVYNAIAEWVAKEYGLNKKDFVRPFRPNGDYQSEKYKSTDVVVDNPPFSILSEIIKWYSEHNIRFFLFAPTMTLFSSSSSSSCACAIPCGGNITYENGAVVPTSFVTNLEDYRIRVIPELYQIIDEANTQNQAQFKRTIPKYKYPDEIVTAAMCRYMCEHGVALVIKKEDSQLIRQLDSQKELDGSGIFGSGFILSEKAAAEKAAAEKAAAEKAAAEKVNAIVWELSDREREIIKSLGNH
jgi:hypothetical protein